MYIVYVHVQMYMYIYNPLEDYPTYMYISYYLSLYTLYLHYIQLGERRIRVHTLCLPVSDQLPQLYAGINLLATTAVLAKMGESNNY